MVQLSEMRDAVVLLGLIALIAAAVAIALTEFQATDTVTTDSFADNITQSGLEGVDSSTTFLSTIGVIIGVAVLITIVVGAFSIARR